MVGVVAGERDGVADVRASHCVVPSLVWLTATFRRETNKGGSCARVRGPETKKPAHPKVSHTQPP